jgi:hypothetical protein
MDACKRAQQHSQAERFSPWGRRTTPACAASMAVPLHAKTTLLLSSQSSTTRTARPEAELHPIEVPWILAVPVVQIRDHDPARLEHLVAVVVKVLRAQVRR